MNNALHEQGAALLSGVLREDQLSRLKNLFICDANLLAPIAYSLSMEDLVDRGLCSLDEIRAPIYAAGLMELLDSGLQCRVECNLKESWLRRRFAPANAPRFYHPNSWHQDGGLGGRFGSDPMQIPPMTRLLTCWAPLDPCGESGPGLEFITRRLDALLHYTELEDSRLRERFPADAFWAPKLEPGDVLLILPGTLHRTYVRPEMTRDRLSLEYRFFPVE